MGRPSFLLLAAVWAGLASGGLVGSGPAPLVAALACLAAALARTRSDRLRLAWVAGAFLVLGILRSPDYRWGLGPDAESLRASQAVPVVAWVKTRPLAADCAETVPAAVESVMVGPVVLEGRQVLLRGLDGLKPPGARRFKVCGTFSAPGRRLNDFGPDQAARYRRLGAVGAVDVAAISSEPAWPASQISGFRESLEGAIRGSRDGEAPGMLEAMLLGQRSRLSPRVETVMLRAGTYHVISVSGLHVAIVLFIMSAFLSVLGLPRLPLLAVHAAATVFYVVFTGTPPSAARSGGLFLTAGLVKALQWKVDAANCVCATGAGLLLAAPRFAWDIGFQLSLGAVLGMVMLTERTCPGWPGRPGRLGAAARHLVSGLVVCLTAQAFTLPVVLRDFGRVSTVAPLGNLVMVPLTTLALGAGMQASVALLFWEPLAAVCLKAAAAVTALSLAATGWIAALPWALVYSGRPGPARLVPYCAAMAYLSFLAPRGSKKANLLVLVVCQALLAAPCPRLGQNVLTADFLHVGDGDAAVLGLPDGRAMLVDAGPDAEALGWSQGPVVSFAATRGINRFDQVVVTHSHSDHYGGLRSLLDNVAVGEVLVGALDGEPDYLAVLEHARARGIPVRRIQAGDFWHCGRASIRVLHPPAGDSGAGDDANARSVVMRVEFGEFSLLLTGDATREVGRELARARGDVRCAAAGCKCGWGGDQIRCTVLKAPHHGAPNSLDPAFLAGCKAAVAVVSAGSRWACHPWPATLEMLRASGALPLVTSAEGAVSVVTDGVGVDITTQAGTRLCIAAGRRD